MRCFMFLLGVITLGFSFGMLGCNSASTSKNSGTTTVSADQPEHAQENAPNPNVLKGLAELSPEDRALAENQKVCPVSGEPLGAMGAPVKLDVKGQPVFICCEGCKDKILSNPDEYLAKLKK